MPDHKPGANLALSVVRAVACQGAVYSRQQTYCNETLLTASRLPTIAVAQSFFTGMSRERIKLLAKRSVVTVLSMPRHRHTERCLNTVAFDSTVCARTTHIISSQSQHHRSSSIQHLGGVVFLAHTKRSTESITTAAATADDDRSRSRSPEGDTSSSRAASRRSGDTTHAAACARSYTSRGDGHVTERACTGPARVQSASGRERGPVERAATVRSSYAEAL